MIYVLFAIIAGIVAVDQVTKIIFSASNFSVLGDFLWFYSVQNEGAAFSMLEGGRWWFVAISVPVLVGLFYIMISGKLFDSKFFRVTIAIMIGGIVGNLIDRVLFGYVRDFIYFKSINFAVFNIADMALTVSCVLLIIYIIFFAGKSDNKKPDDKKVETLAKEKPEETVKKG